MKANSTYIALYPNIVPVRGFSRSVLMDLYMGKFLFIPNYFCDFLLENKAKNLQKEEFLNLGGSENDLAEIKSLLDHLISQDYLVEADSTLLEGFKTDTPVRTEDSLITDCILELSALSEWEVGHFLAEINNLGIKFLEVRFLDFISFENHYQMMQEAFQNHSIEFLHFLVPFDKQLESVATGKLPAFTRLGQLTVYNTLHTFETNELPFKVDFSTQKSIDHSLCGCIDPTYFNYNVPAYYSNRKKNSCLSHKLSIDQFGEIKNCPSKKESFGRVATVDLELTVQLEAFKKEWHITKESILICSDCEFRWMCSDCRVFIQDESNSLSKPVKCGYNPYINKWINEPGYLTESACGVSIQNKAVSIDELRIKKINDALWS